MGGDGESFESNKDGKRRQGQVDPIFNAWTFLLADAEDEMNFPPPLAEPYFHPLLEPFPRKLSMTAFFPIRKLVPYAAAEGYIEIAFLHASAGTQKSLDLIFSKKSQSRSHLQHQR